MPANRTYTVGIIKPDVVAHGKTDEIIMKVDAQYNTAVYTTELLIFWTPMV